MRKAFHWLGHVWAYLTRHWLRLTIPNGDPNRGRWPEHPTWAAVRDGFAPLALRGAEAPEQKLELVRATRYTGYRRLLYRMAVGITTTLEQMEWTPITASMYCQSLQCHVVTRKSGPWGASMRSQQA